MKNEVFSNSIRFVLLLLLQVLVLNNVALFGYIVPFLYVIYILRFPVTGNRSVLLVSSFLLGLFVDIFSNTGGVHAVASVTMAYSRPLFLKTSFGISYEYNVVKIIEMPLGGIITYVLGAVFVHHFILFSLEVFSLSQWALVLKSTLFSVLFSSLLILISFILLGSRKR